MTIAIQILQQHLESLKYCVINGSSISSLAQKFEEDISDIELAIHNLKMLETSNPK